MSPVHLRDLAIPRNQPEDREGLSKTRRAGREHLGHSGGWQDIEGNHTHSAIHFPILQKPQTRRLRGYGSSSSAPPAPERPFSWSMDNKSFNLESHWEELEESFQKICLKEIEFKDLMVTPKVGIPPGSSHFWRREQPG
ncbi:hypothetical protein O181_009954 [Austropuccinia psidii MF-1]|uniref:Uncharacterized protein n=1 Tax=Austropuccinia psidii MF-1 TaxID=1389203 RepID=A0A9Q3BRP5_9BASI|nr:hypothetical protein [Austropuccinia psidii MF-1]